MSVAIVDSSNSTIATYFVGYYGVYRKEGSGEFRNIMKKPFPERAWGRKCKTALLLDSGRNRKLLVGTFGGLYSYKPHNDKWDKIYLHGESERVMKIVRKDNRVYIFTESEVFVSRTDKLKFERQTLSKTVGERDISMVEFFFDLHSGGMLGLGGRLLMDAAGLVLIFLSCSAIFIWFFPKKRNFEKKRHKTVSKSELNFFKANVKYHELLGISSVLLLLIFGVTGLFMRPPLMAVLLGKYIDKSFYLGMSSDNDFHGQIRNAMFDRLSGRLLLDTKNGVWIEIAPNATEFKPLELPVPIFAMGATVFEQNENGNFLVGSFAGLFEINYATGEVTDKINNSQTIEFSSGRPSDNLVTGYFKDNIGREYISSHFGGLSPLGNHPKADYTMPEIFAKEGRLSLWNYAFELHNARFFADWIGDWYILIIPLASLLFILISLTGILDWIWRKRNRLKKVFYR